MGLDRTPLITGLCSIPLLADRFYIFLYELTICNLKQFGTIIVGAV